MRTFLLVLLFFKRQKFCTVHFHVFEELVFFDWWIPDSGFRFLSGSGFLILGLPDNRQASPRPNNKCEMNMNRQTNAKQTKARTNPNGTNSGLRVQKTAMLQDGQNKRLIADCRLYSTAHTVIITGVGDMICNTISQYYRCAND